MKRIMFLFLAAIICIGGCKRKYPDTPPSEEIKKEQMLDINKSAVHDEAKSIEDFIAHHGWKMKMTGTGLHYEIYEKGSGQMADANHIFSIAYKVFLLDGTLCYEADEKHPLKLLLGRGQQINGLEEGLLLMNEGSRARFVIPNHLAYGLTGDQDKVPPASALYYDVHLIKLEPIPVK